MRKSSEFPNQILENFKILKIGNLKIHHDFYGIPKTNEKS